MKKIATLILALATATMALPAAAQFAKPEDAIQYRRSSMSVLQTHFFRLANMVNGRTPFDPKAAVANADIVLAMSKLPWPAFGPGTGVGDTRAKPSIWTQQAKFNDTAQKMMTLAGTLDAEAKTGDLDKLKVAFRATAGTCQTCHDAFRGR
ncbi:cytochrome c [soil metagenome]